MFGALADPTRRAVLERLGEGDASIGELAQPFDMALPSLMKHVRVLEAVGLVESQKSGRVRTCRLKPAAMTDAEMACCKKMAGECDMGSGNHSCCQHTISATPTVATAVRSSQPDLLALARTSADIYGEFSLKHYDEALQRSAHAPETSPLDLKLILRI